MSIDLYTCEIKLLEYTILFHLMSLYCFIYNKINTLYYNIQKFVFTVLLDTELLSCMVSSSDAKQRDHWQNAAEN